MISWLLGGSTALGLAGVVVLAIFIARQAERNRHDLREQVDLVKQLVAATTALDAHVQVLNEKEDELTRERAAQKELSDALDRATEELAQTGTTSSALASLRASLDRLRKLSEAAAVPAPASDDDTDRLHGSFATADREPRGPGGPPRTGRPG